MKPCRIPDSTITTIVELLEQHGLEGDRLIAALIQADEHEPRGRDRPDPLRARRVQGRHPDHPSAYPPNNLDRRGVGAGMAQWFFGARCCRR